MLSKALFSILPLGFLLVSPCLATNWYVDNGASGSNEGTSWTDAWESFADITWSTGGVIAGDTLYISGGSTSKTYNETLTVGVSGSSKETPVYIKPGSASPSPSGHDGQVRIDGQNTRSHCIDLGGYDYIHIDGNDGDSGRNIYCEDSTESGISCDGVADGEVIKYVHVYNVGLGEGSNSHGIHLQACQGESEIAYCYIDSPWRHGMALGGATTATDYGSNFSVHNCTITNIGTDGIACDLGFDIYDNIIGGFDGSAGSYSDGIQYYGGYARMYNNVWLEDFPSDPGAGQRVNAMIYMEMGSGNPSITEFSHHQIYNNLMIASDWSYDDGGTNRCILLGNRVGDTTINDILVANNTMIGFVSLMRFGNDGNTTILGLELKNNIMMDGSSGLLDFETFDDGSSTVEIEDNLFYCRSGRCDGNVFTFDGNNYASLAAFEAGESEASSNEWGDPTFVAFTEGDYGSSDYHLALNDTVAKDLAQTLIDFSTDKDGISRPQGSAWDIGAYEYEQMTEILKGSIKGSVQ